jgi:molybdopterin converting factor subunit 1
MRSVAVLFFATARDAAGCESAEVSWDGGTALTQDEFWALLEARFPRLAASRTGMRLARNLEYIEAGAPLFPGDEVAVIPPVSGG